MHTFNFSAHCFNFHTFPAPFLAINPKRVTPVKFQQPKSLPKFQQLRICVLNCKNQESEGDWELEEEILEFMRKSKKQDSFPSKKELVDAKRMDLVDAISKQGGWLSLGWDVDDKQDDEERLIKSDERSIKIDESSDNGAVLRKMDNTDHDIWEGCHEFGSSMVDSSSSSSESASSSGRSLYSEAGDDTGIEGILSGVEKQRNITYGIDISEKRDGSYNVGNDWQRGSLISGSVAWHDRSEKYESLNPYHNVSYPDGLRNSLKPDMWRSWSNQRAGVPDAEEFEAAEITFNESREYSTQELLEIKDGTTESLDNHIQIRLKHMKLELASTLRSIRFKSDELNTQKSVEESSEDFHKLSDAWELKENEIMDAKDRLRSTRAKLTVLEGKMTLAKIEAHKLAEEKQRRIEGAHKALSLLKTVCIGWPNSASEVLLSGSFDGWITQRKMLRSSNGIFSLYLKLYPGTYEVKFIVDGIWKIDPLRPIVNNGGFENNLLIVP